MKIQRTPLILLAIALILGIFVYFYEVQGKPQREAAQAQTEQLFGFKEEEVRSLTLTTPSETLTFAKTPAAQVSPALKADQKADQNASTQPQPGTLIWAMTAPDKTVASDASVAYLLNLLATGKRQQTLKVPIARQSEFGFDKPMAIAEIRLANQQSHRLILGKPNFNRSALYAQVDPPAQPTTDLSVALVSSDFENAVNRPLADWKAKEPAAQPSVKQLPANQSPAKPLKQPSSNEPAQKRTSP